MSFFTQARKIIEEENVMERDLKEYAKYAVKCREARIQPPSFDSWLAGDNDFEAYQVNDIVAEGIAC